MSELPAKLVAEKMDNFRLYYNRIIHPELSLLEKQRKRLVAFMAISLVGIAIVGYLTYAAHIPALSLFLWIPISLYASYIALRIRQYRIQFKPKIVGLILEFIESGDKIGELEAPYDTLAGADRQLHYDYKRSIDVEKFEDSGIFKSQSTYYHGEDYIYGTIGNVRFEMSELDVKKLSRTRPGFEQIFRGIFFHANFHTDTHSRIVIFPKKNRPFMMPTIKNLTQNGGFQVKIRHEAFSEAFLVYSDNEFQDQQLLSKEVYDAILRYKVQTNRDVFVAFDHKDIYIALSNDKDILEPKILSSNLSYQLVKEFFDELMIAIEIVEYFEWHN